MTAGRAASSNSTLRNTREGRPPRYGNAISPELENRWATQPAYFESFTRLRRMIS